MKPQIIGFKKKFLLILTLMSALLSSTYLVALHVKSSLEKPVLAASLDLSVMVPERFGDWSIVAIPDSVSLTSEQEDTLKRIYTSTLTRDYVNSLGQHVILSLAYGGDQREGLQVHKPEICYPAQGINIVESLNDAVPSEYGKISVKRLVAKNLFFEEPITYWIRVGESVANGRFSWRIEQLKLNIQGKVADGLLFRVSSRGADKASQYALQDKFIRDLLSAIPSEKLHFFIGQKDNGK